MSKRKPLAGDKDIVLDDQGRRRFHGAFTGGFSAGYFNTVGSKEGFTPQTFVSSRRNRFSTDTDDGGSGKDDRNNQGNSLQKPEDFMDEEDGLLGAKLRLLMSPNLPLGIFLYVLPRLCAASSISGILCLSQYCLNLS